MFEWKTAKRFCIGCLTAAAVAGLSGQACLAQGDTGTRYPGGQAPPGGAPGAPPGPDAKSEAVPGVDVAKPAPEKKTGEGALVAPAVPVPLVKPKVDQLGQMEGVPVPDRTGLVVMLFLQVVALVVVAIALAGHLSLPAKRKTPKA